MNEIGDKKRSFEIKPLLRWAGSKRLALTYLKDFWKPGLSKYHEPFCGSASLFFRMCPEVAILSDLNAELIAFYRHCADRPEIIWQEAVRIDRTKETYYAARTEYNSLNICLRKSALFYYLNRNCFNGIYRTNKNGIFNVPFSGSRTPDIPTLDNFLRCSEPLKTVELISGDFESILLKNVGVNDFVFLDPPYATDSKRTFAEYNENSFSVPDIGRVISTLRMINSRGAHFLCTYDATQEQSFESVSEWIVGRFEVNRNVGGFQKSRRKAKEVILSNVLQHA
jgi:DNA adenine methylase